MSRIRAMVVITLLDINDSQHQQYNAKILTKYFLWSWNVDKNSNIENQNCVLFDENTDIAHPWSAGWFSSVSFPWEMRMLSFCRSGKIFLRAAECFIGDTVIRDIFGCWLLTGVENTAGDLGPTLLPLPSTALLASSSAKHIHYSVLISMKSFKSYLVRPVSLHHL